MRLNKDKQIQIPLPDVRWLARDEESLHKLLPARETWLSTRCRNCDALLEISGNWPGGSVNCPACGHRNPLPSRDAIGIVRRTCHNCGAWVYFFRRATDQDRCCPDCGAWINKSVKASPPEKNHHTNPKDSIEKSNSPASTSASPFQQPKKSSLSPSPKKLKAKKSHTFISLLIAKKIKISKKQKKSPLIDMLILLFDYDRKKRIEQRRNWNKFAKNIENCVPKISGSQNWDGTEHPPFANYSSQEPTVKN